eukprot:1882089-Prymnesium_polylepis.1
MACRLTSNDCCESSPSIRYQPNTEQMWCGHTGTHSRAAPSPPPQRARPGAERDVVQAHAPALDGANEPLRGAEDDPPGLHAAAADAEGVSPRSAGVAACVPRRESQYSHTKRQRLTHGERAIDNNGRTHTHTSHPCVGATHLRVQADHGVGAIARQKVDGLRDACRRDESHPLVQAFQQSAHDPLACGRRAGAARASQLYGGGLAREVRHCSSSCGSGRLGRRQRGVAAVQGARVPSAAQFRRARRPEAAGAEARRPPH